MTSWPLSTAEFTRRRRKPLEASTCTHTERNLSEEPGKAVVHGVPGQDGVSTHLHRAAVVAAACEVGAACLEFHPEGGRVNFIVEDDLELAAVVVAAKALQAVERIQLIDVLPTLPQRRVVVHCMLVWSNAKRLLAHLRARRSEAAKKASENQYRCKPHICERVRRRVCLWAKRRQTQRPIVFLVFTARGS